MPDIVKIRSLPSASDLSDGDYAAVDNSTDGLRKVALGGIISDLKSDFGYNERNLNYNNLKTVQDYFGVSERFYPSDLESNYSGSGQWAKVDEVVDTDTGNNVWCTIIVKVMNLSSVGKLRIYDAGFNVLLLDNITQPGVYAFKTNSVNDGIGIRMQVSTDTVPTAGYYCVKGMAIYNADITGSYDPMSNIQRITDNTNLFNPATATDNTRINGNGGTQSHSGYYTSALSPVAPNVYYHKNSPSEDDYHRMAVYDSTGTFITGQLYTVNDVLMPSTAAYIRICGKMEEKATTKVTAVSAADYIARREINEIKETLSGTEQVVSLLGSNGVIVKESSANAESDVTITNFPIYLKKNTAVSFYGKFSTFSGLLVGKGHNAYRGDWVEISASQIIFHHYEASDTTKKTVSHGLTIDDYIMVSLRLDDSGTLTCAINTTGGTFVTNLETDNNVFCGNTFAIPSAGMTDVQLGVSNGDTKLPVWFIGDSYVGLNADRVFGQLKSLGYWGGYLGDGLAGLDSQGAYAEFNKLLQFGTPKLLIWYLGMNDTDADYLSYLTLVKTYCEAHNITLILNRVPSVPSRAKEAIGGYVIATGCRYIDSYAAVGANSSGTWYTGYLSSDNIHPTQLGAKALAMRVLVDVPELMEYGFNPQTVSGDTSGDQ